jgi:hypothetical protein
MGREAGGVQVVPNVQTVQSPSFIPASRLCRNPRKRADVMLSPSAKLRINSAKHLAISRNYEDEIFRLRLRMKLRHSLVAAEEIGGCQCKF